MFVPKLRLSVLMLICTVLALANGASATITKPNIVWFLTDDQDQLLGASFPPTAPGGATPMPQTKALMADQGSTAANFYIHTPICCPSRSELVSGRYYHNIKTTHAPACMHVDETIVNNATFARYLNESAGYRVGMFGKYLNNVPNFVPPGFHTWMANGGGTYIASSFSVNNLPGVPNGHWQLSNSAANYSTSVIGNRSIEFITTAVADKVPFFAYVAPKAAHEPFNPAPWYVDAWDDSWPLTEPRPPSWNCTAESRADHHGSIATNPMITEAGADVITGVFKNRWRTLMSVDDAIAGVIKACIELGVDDNTYYFYSSDHGFQLGEFNILMDKRNVYDWDTKIHLLARGPGITHGSTWIEPATQVDMAPTFLGLAGVPKPVQMDGKSLVPLLVQSDSHQLLASTRAHLSQLGSKAASREAYVAGWRDSVFIEYYFNDDNVKCVGNCTPGKAQYPAADSECTELDKSPNGKCFAHSQCPTDCYPTESYQNNFIAVRNMKGSKMGNTLYAEFEDGYKNQSWSRMKDITFEKADFVEYFDCEKDPWQMTNLAKTADAATLAELHAKVQAYYKCAGDACP